VECERCFILKVKSPVGSDILRLRPSDFGFSPRPTYSFVEYCPLGYDALCSMVDFYINFGGNYFSHLLGRNLSHVQFCRILPSWI
jgi:hypothetical protein